MCFQALPKVLANPNDLEARGQMLLGAAYAGTAIENSMLGCAHSAANPLTAHLGVIHGEAVGRLIAGVIRRNCSNQQSLEEYTQLARSCGLSSVEGLLERFDEILALAQLTGSLNHVRVTQELVSTMAREAATQWTASFNPVPFTVADFESLYGEVLG